MVNPGSNNQQRPTRITASSLAFLPECTSCQWYSHNCTKPPRGIPMPKIFTAIDGINKHYYDGLECKDISPSLPPGKLGHGNLFLESEEIPIPGHSPVVFTGKIDTLATFDNNAGFGILDFKTSNPRVEHIPEYQWQLGAYALMAEHPAPKRPHLFPVTRLGLVCLTPYEMLRGKTGKLGYLVRPEFIPLVRDDQALLDFVATKVLDVIELPSQPPPSPDCQWCQYRDCVLNGC